MARRGRSEVDVMVDRAMHGSERPAAAPGRRTVYNGDLIAGNGAYALRSNRRPTRRAFSTFNIIMLLFAAGIAIVLYVNNIITINRLAVEVGQLRTRHEAILNANASLRAEVNRKAAWERIGKVATEQLGLRFPTEQPGWFTVDERALDRLTTQ